MSKATDQLLPNIGAILSEMDKETIYFDGLNKIEEKMAKLRESSPRYRIIVFIDDLDRCSPKKMLEVLESIKVFLDIDGFIYVLGISHETLTKIITSEYKDTNIKGEDYIKKIIQIPISIPVWSKIDIGYLLEHLLAKKLIDPKYSAIIEKNKDLISKAINSNPREYQEIY